MTLHRSESRQEGRYFCVGSGLVTLDVVVDENLPNQYMARSGGSCGNVMAILAYLGWTTYPIARLGQDQAARMILEDFNHFGVDTRFISRDPAVDTPAIIEDIHDSRNGARTHSYTLRCPHCGYNLLRYRAIQRELTDRVIGERYRTQAFYFDRLSKGIITLARHYRQQGALIVFEPSGIRDRKLFRAAADVSHILKYSNDRLPNIAAKLGDYLVPLEIQTFGRNGLRYRYRDGDSRSPWKEMPAFRVSDAIDEAGSGDWCTSGIIYSLGRYGATSFWRTRSIGIARALELGQALAAVNCRFKSARGTMYSLSPHELLESAFELIEGKLLSSKDDSSMGGMLSELFQSICPRCSQAG